jgi:hypothetical protein
LGASKQGVELKRLYKHRTTTVMKAFVAEYSLLFGLAILFVVWFGPLKFSRIILVLFSYFLSKYYNKIELNGYLAY